MEEVEEKMLASHWASQGPSGSNVWNFEACSLIKKKKKVVCFSHKEDSWLAILMAFEWDHEKNLAEWSHGVVLNICTVEM